MADDIRISEGAELKYINQAPRADHGACVAIFVETYCDETDDYPLLDMAVHDKETQLPLTMRQRVSAAIQWLIKNVGRRGPDFIEQGDWNAPMNIVGRKGHFV